MSGSATVSMEERGTSVKPLLDETGSPARPMSRQR